MSPQPQFYALSIDTDEAVYFFGPSCSLAGLDKEAIASLHQG